VKVTEEELKALQGTKVNATIIQLKAEAAAIESARAAAESRVAELEYENTLLKIYLNYGLTEDHVINETTGEIVKKEEADDSQEADESTES